MLRVLHFEKWRLMGAKGDLRKDAARKGTELARRFRGKKPCSVRDRGKKRKKDRHMELPLREKEGGMFLKNPWAGGKKTSAFPTLTCLGGEGEGGNRPESPEGGRVETII